MDALHVHRFRARHLATDADGRRRALAAQQALLDGELEGAVAAALGTGGDDEIVLLRRLAVRVKLPGRHSDHDNARVWGDALALGLQRTLQHGDATTVLRFAQHGQALAAFVEDAVRGVDVRDWAWQRLGLLPASPERRNSPAQRRHALLRCLADDAQHSVPLLRRLQGGAVWTALLQDLHDAELRGLVQATLAQLAGRGAAPFTALLADATPAPLTGAALAPPAAALQALEAVQAAQAVGSPGRALWALRLTALLLQPALARRGSVSVDAQVGVWMRTLQAAAASGTTRSTARAHAGGAAPGTAARPDGADEAARPPATVPQADRAGPAEAPGPRAAAPEAAPARTPAPGRQTARDPGFTTHGGLLLLTPLLPGCGALALLEDPAVWPAGSLPQALHRLALQLAPLRADDPAALAFCGLTPASLPPAPLALGAALDGVPHVAPHATPHATQHVAQHATPHGTQHKAQDAALDAPQAAALRAAHALLLDALHQRLPDWRGPALLQRVVARPARIAADPGWIEVSFPLREVAVELRRAALDLDPGFVPWLGVVLRFRYE